MTHITQRTADMAMWQAFIMANGDPNCGDLQDAWDALGEAAMREKAIVASDHAYLLWNQAAPKAREKYEYSDFCAAFLKMVAWVGGPDAWQFQCQGPREMFDALFPVPF